MSWACKNSYEIYLLHTRYREISIFTFQPYALSIGEGAIIQLRNNCLYATSA